MIICALDIKKDIIDDVSKKLQKENAFVENGVGYFPAPSEATKTINSINREFKNIVIKEGEKGSFIIDPPPALINQYYQEYMNSLPEPEEPTPTKLEKENDTTFGVDEFGDSNTNLLFQIKDKKELEPNIEELDKFLLNFLKSFGVQSKEFEELKSKLGVDALGATDVLNKLIWYTKNRNEETVPEEVGHMITMLMGKNSPIMRELLSEIVNWSEYSQVVKDYMPIYKNIEKVKIEAIGKLLAKSFVKNYKAYGFNQSLLEKALDYIKKLLEAVNDLFSAWNYSEKLADKITINVLLGRKDFIKQLESSYFEINKQIDYKESLENNPLAKDIIKNFSEDLYNPLVGSLAIAAQGEDIFRPNNEPIHDLDFIVDGRNPDNINKLDSKLKEFNAVPVHSGWKHSDDGYTTYAYFIPKKGHTVTVLEREKGWAKKIEIRDDKGNIVPISPTTVISTDFFIYKVDPKRRNIKNFASWNDIFYGKLLLSPKGKNEVLFDREKDQRDYILINPKNRNLISDPAFIYYQLNPAQTEEMDNFYNKVLDNAKRTVLDKNPDDRHYTFDGQRVATTVSTKAKEGSKIKEFTPEEKIINDQKKDWGLEGHSYVENYIKTNLIDENGYVKPFTDTPIASNLPSDIKSALNSYLKELVSSYRPGTRFMLEVLQTNPKVQGMISSTVDFKAFIPDAKTGFKVDTLDWKFTTVNTKYGQEDISWFKSKEWKSQMGEYNKMDYSLGLKPNQVGKSRMIPFVLEYQYRKPGNSKSGLYPSTIQIANFKDLKNTKTYLLPVPTSAESTGNPLVDELVSSLSAYYEKLYSKAPVADVAERELKREELNDLSAAIKRLQVSLDFKPLMEVASNFLKRADRLLKDSIENGFENSNIEDIKSILDNILELKNSSEKFVDLDEIFLGDQSREDLSKADKLLLAQLGSIAAATKRLQSVMSALQADAVVELVAKKGFIEDENKDKLKKAQIEMQSMEKNFNEGTKLSNNLIAIGSSMWLRVKNSIATMFSKKMDEIAPAIIQLEKDAKSQGKTAFQLIGEVRNGSLRLIRKLSTEFFDAYKKAQEEEDKEFFLKNMDVEKYNKLASEYVKKRTEEIEAREYEGEEEDVYWRKENAITDVKNSVLINSKTFNGWDEYVFNKFFKDCLIEENHYSPEYLKMSQNSSAKQVWDYFTSLNNLAKQMGYKSVGSSFFPLIEATMISKLAQSKDKAGQLKDFFTDFYTAKAVEEQSFSKLDPETNKLKLEIPKLFTRTNKNLEQLSTDLTKVASLWTQSLMEYQATKEFESTLLSLQQLNKSRGHIVVDPNTQSVVMEGGAPRVDRSSNKDDELFQAIINDSLYKMQENLNSFGNIQIGKLGNKLGKTEEEKEKKTIATKKIIQTADKLVQQIAVGLKPLVAIPNLIGVKLQSFINAGEFYRFREFEKNSLKAVTKVPLIEKALLHTFIPINENVALEKQREIAGKQGFAKWLSTWSFMDVMMSTNAYPEKRLQIANALSFFDNTTIINGKLVNIRQYLKQQDAKEKYKPGADLKAIEKSFESRVKEMKEKQSISKLAKIEDDKLVIPGVSDEEISKYRTKIIEYGRNLTGQMNMDNKANYRRDTMFRSFMMFKNWIPKQIYVRGAGLKQNRELDNWDYGRTRAFLKVFTDLGFRNIAQISDVVRATPKGLEILDRILEEKKQEHFRKTGEELEITKEEFYDLMRTHIKNQVKELEVLLGLFVLFLAAKLAKPPDDEDDLAKNRYKWYMKLTNKIYDEVGFYYNPLSFDSITKGSVTPSLSILVKASKFLTHLSKLGVAGVSGNDENWEKAHPTKYFLNMIPIASQFNNDILPYIFPELAKEEGIKVTEESRQR